MSSNFDFDLDEVYFQGFWLADPSQDLAEPTPPFALLFFGPGFMIRLDAAEDEEGDEVTAMETVPYALGEGVMITLHTIESEDGEDEEVQGEAQWRLDDEGRLHIEFGRGWVRFVSVGVDELVASGFERGAVEGLVESAEAGGVEFEIKPDEPFVRVADG